MDTLSNHPFEGKSIGQYTIERKLGRGGMGVVFRAMDTKLRRPVALKFLPPDEVVSDAVSARFVNEARAASALDHPNICTIYDASTTADGLPFIAMALYEGRSVRDLIDAGALSVDDSVDLAMQCASGLAKAHTASIVHRDIKPANLFVTDDGTLKILDFGIAKLPGVQMTKTNQTVGTTSFMSPEQIRGEVASPASDIWSLGATLFEMLSGTKPFSGPYDASVLYAVVNEPPADLVKLNPKVTESIAAIVYRCLEKDPAERYASADGLRADLLAICRGDSVAGGSSSESGATRSRGVRSRSVDVAHVQETESRSGTGTIATITRWAEVIPKAKGIRAVSMSLVALVGVVAITVWSQNKILGARDGNSGQVSVAVLPFTFSSVSPASAVDSAFVTGLLYTVTNKLAQIELLGSQLSVVPAADVQLSNIRSARQAAQELNVNQVIGGTVEAAAAGIKITLQLIDTDDATPRILDTRELDVPSDMYASLPATIVSTLTDLFSVELTTENKDDLVEGDSKNSEAYRFYVQAVGYSKRFVRSDDMDTAIRLYELAIQQDSSYALAYAGLGQALIERYRVSEDPRDVERAVAVGERARRLDSRAAEVRFTLGQIYLAHGEYDKAEPEFLLAIEREEHFADAHMWLGLVYQGMGDVVRAEKSFKDAIALKPGYWRFYNALGKFYDAAERHDEAIVAFKSMIAAQPSLYWGYFNVGTQYHAMGDLDNALVWYEKAKNVNPSDENVADNNLATASIKYVMNDFPASAALWKEVLRYYKQSYSYWHDYGNALFWSNDVSTAGMAWYHADSLARVVLDIRPTDTGPLSTIALIAAKTGNRLTALDYVSRLLEGTQIEGDDYLQLVKIFEILGNRVQALQYADSTLAAGVDPFVFEVSPWLDGLRSSSEFAALVQKYSRTVS